MAAVVTLQRECRSHRMEAVLEDAFCLSLLLPTSVYGRSSRPVVYQAARLYKCRRKQEHQLLAEGVVPYACVGACLT